MAMLPVLRSLTIGLGVAGALLVGPIAPATPLATAATACGIGAADEPGVPPTPDPVPDNRGPVDQAPPQAQPPVHRRHIDGDPIIER